MRSIQNPKSKIQVGPDAGTALDYELARRISEGDREALSLLLDRHAGTVYAYAARRLGPENEDLAADVTQATFQQALRHLKPYARGTASTPMRLWLLRLASEQLADETVAASDKPDDTFLTVRTTLGKLPPRQQTVFSLALLEGLSPEEIAAASGMSLPRAMGALRSSLKRAAESLDEGEES
jgi:DNA-directed RNA polymerase specialized sigma24 family protein